MMVGGGLMFNNHALSVFRKVDMDAPGPSLPEDKINGLTPHDDGMNNTAQLTSFCRKPERLASSGEKVPKWSWRAIKAFTMAELEARKLKFANTGTEALLLGILIEGTSVAAKYLWANGITVFKVREETIKVLGKADMYYFPPERPPLTDDAQKVLDLVLDHKLKSGDSGEVTTSDLLLGIWSEVESPGHKILAVLGFNDEKAKELEALSSGPGFIDG
ncbi:hypothetical protein SADUNF_Sadunf01G0091900 [Salix dunnii]|uniref:Clp R domain-containing protein n=1 Tax=Salix dunnii TaxID=1413687 RepID=A0A835NAX4_9ROSI|nr:hypothetical protein SADUNF_Sadunf01G0091900 [Salix dunnii]